MGVVQMIMGVDDHHHRLAGEVFGHLLDAVALHFKCHGIDNDGSFAGAQYTDISAHAFQHVQIFGDLLRLKGADLYIGVCDNPCYYNCHQ